MRPRCGLAQPRAWILGAVVMAALGGWSTAGARPVRTGRYLEIPYGVREDHPWATEGGNAHRNGRVGAQAPSARPSLAWEARLGLGRLSAPAVTAEGVLYVPGASGVAALDAGGSTLWTERVGYVTSTPSLTPTDGLVVGTSTGGLVQLGARGEDQHRTAVGGQVRGSPLVLADGSIVVAAMDQAVHRFDAEARRLFRVPLDAHVQGTPVWSRTEEILVPVRDRLLLLGVRGDERGQVSLGSAIVSGPAVADDGSIWVLTEDAALHQLSPRLVARTRTEIGGQVTVATGIAVGRDGAVRVPTRDDALVCVGPNGTERWRLAGEGGFLAGLSLDVNDVALTVTAQGTLLAVAPGGQVLWRIETHHRSESPPVLAPDGTLYLATARGTLQAYR